MGSWSPDALDGLLKDAAGIPDAGERVAFLAGRFLGVAYGEGTLVGGPGTPEELVIDFEAMDCFTFIDYIEALRRSRGFASFEGNLREVRYRGGAVAFAKRRHFFSDWIEPGSQFLRDATAEVGGIHTTVLRKTLNERKDGRLWVPGIGFEILAIGYVPARYVDASALARLRSGDYLGIYSEEPGLDVSHVGIAVKATEGIVLRHASSHPGARKVVDQDLREYLSGKPGIVVIRPIGP